MTPTVSEFPATTYAGGSAWRAPRWVGLLAVASLVFPPAVLAAPSAPLPYVVRPRDTLIGIGRALLIRPGDWREVARLNRIGDPRRLPIGKVVLIPAQLMRSEAAPATVVQTIGDVRMGAAQSLRAGEQVPEGAVIETGDTGYATLRLADGTLLRVQAATRTQLERARRYVGLGAIESAVELARGRVEVQVTPVAGGKPRFEVRSPQGVLGVRGTEFRVTADDLTVETRGEVLQGAVDVEGIGQARHLAAGFGTVVDRTSRVAEPTPLLAAPDLSSLPTLQERVLVRLPVPALAGANAYRGQVAQDDEFQQIVGEYLAKSAELRFGDLPDGNYHLRVRAVDARGLEGRAAEHRFRLKARPEAPLISAPAPRTKLRATGVEFAWSVHPEAKTYRFQLARDAAFANVLRDQTGIAESKLAASDVAPGDYFWRLASVRGDGDQGPWGEAHSFVLRAPPAQPEPPVIDDRTIRFAWSGEPGQTFDLQIARDPQFKQLVLERRLAEPGAELPRPVPGTYFVRYRALDADGFVGPFATAQRFELINCVVDSAKVCVRTTYGPLLSP